MVFARDARRRGRFAVVLTLVLILVQPVCARAASFLTGFEDLPLMPGLSEQDGAGLMFDTPAGRILEAMAAGEATQQQVQTFYAQTLPELGWVRQSDTQYRRDQEVLRLDFSQAGRVLTVRFTISPE